MGKPPWSTKAFVRTVREIEQHDLISSGDFVGEFRDRGRQERTEHAVMSRAEATESYMVEVIAESPS